MIKDPLVYVHHIRDAINLIEEFISNYSEENFARDKLVQSAVVRQMEIIGEATKNLPMDFREKYKEVPWKGIAGMRDRIIHHYFDVNLKRVWNVVKEDLPSLKRQIQRIMKVKR